MKKDETLDTLGLYCPLPVMLTTERIKMLEKDQILEVLADDPEAIEDIPNWCKTTGNKFLKVIKENGVYKFYLKKG